MSNVMRMNFWLVAPVFLWRAGLLAGWRWVGESRVSAMVSCERRTAMVATAAHYAASLRLFRVSSPRRRTLGACYHAWVQQSGVVPC